MTTTKSTRAGAQGRPTDMELMLYVDGELDEGRQAEIDVYVAKDEAARRKVSSLRLASGMVREHALASSKDIDIASLVMAKIEAGDAGAAAKSGAGAGPIDINQPRLAKVERPHAANDNSRSIFTLAALAVAAAAAMMIWGRMGAEPLRSADSAPAVTLEAPQKPAEPANPSPSAVDSQAQAPEAEMEHGVEVAAVDFGAHMGTIFYVPTGAPASGSTTTVVWVDDDVAGGK